MTDENETVTDIVAYMRKQAEIWAKKGEPIETCDNYAIIADRIEAAHKREVNKAESTLQKLIDIPVDYTEEGEEAFCTRACEILREYQGIKVAK